MTYRAKDLPAWCRFKPRPVSLPVYTVPTQMDDWLWRALTYRDFDIPYTSVGQKPTQSAVVGATGRLGAFPASPYVEGCETPCASICGGFVIGGLGDVAAD